MGRQLFRKAAGVSGVIWPAVAHPAHPGQRQLIRHVSFVPRVAELSFWKSLVPKPFRRWEQPGSSRSREKPKTKEWNPATFFIVIFLFIGSMSIQMIALKREFDAFMRRSEVRIGLLREVVEKLQKGEAVDVEKVLGTGDAAKEMEWGQVLRELERDDFQNTNTNKRKQPEPPTTEPAPRTKVNPEDKEKRQSKTGGYSNFF
ncbi:hypothetical protein GGS23DRAFT_9967 [Durotheca rogersii]|uniref:uncharacterized protein n=1 Tax=Durotheca rogersii TaxID=419775 RepID=UPI00221F78EC|nr:uncharacterized protein GGS23DRAFT_9967 [Durotheca rogersii]KAI5868070.1 hypothetical protein GGS23DRAFT_9967 [Durotheca rogersii]